MGGEMGEEMGGERRVQRRGDRSREMKAPLRERGERERERREARGGDNHLHRLELGPRLPPRGLRLSAARPRLAQLRLCVVQLVLQPVALAQLRSRKLGTNRRVHVASAIWARIGWRIGWRVGRAYWACVSQ